MTGKPTKEILFDENKPHIDFRRNNFETYVKLYQLVGANSTGISKEALAKAIYLSISFYSNPDTYLKSDSTINYNKYLGIAEEIIQTLGKSKTDMLTPEDFINIMTAEETNFLN